MCVRVYSLFFCPHHSSGLKKTRPSEATSRKCSSGLVHGQFFPFSVVVHLPKLGSQCVEPCENYKSQKWRFRNPGHLTIVAKIITLITGTQPKTWILGLLIFKSVGVSPVVSPKCRQSVVFGRVVSQRLLTFFPMFSWTKRHRNAANRGNWCFLTLPTLFCGGKKHADQRDRRNWHFLRLPTLFMWRKKTRRSARPQKLTWHFLRLPTLFLWRQEHADQRDRRNWHFLTLPTLFYLEENTQISETEIDWHFLDNWQHFGNTLATLGRHFGDTFDNFATLWRHFWHFGNTLATLLTLWRHFGDTFATLWRHFWHFGYTPFLKTTLWLDPISQNNTLATPHFSKQHFDYAPFLKTTLWLHSISQSNTLARPHFSK